MKIENFSSILFFAAACLVGCSSQSEIHLIDGRSFTVKEFHNDGHFLSFASDGWEYTLPTLLLAKEKVEKPAVIQRIIVSTNGVHTLGRIFHGFDDLFLYLDLNAKKSHPVILVLEDVSLWPKDKQRDFGQFFGKNEKRPYVGMEGHWIRD